MCSPELWSSNFLCPWNNRWQGKILSPNVSSTHFPWRICKQSQANDQSGTPGCLWAAPLRSPLTTHPPQPPCDPALWGHSVGSPGSRWPTPHWRQRPQQRRPQRQASGKQRDRSHCHLLGEEREDWGWKGRKHDTWTNSDKLVWWLLSGAQLYKSDRKVGWSTQTQTPSWLATMWHKSSINMFLLRCPTIC